MTKREVHAVVAQKFLNFHVDLFHLIGCVNIIGLSRGEQSEAKYLRVLRRVKRSFRRIREILIKIVYRSALKNVIPGLLFGWLEECKRHKQQHIVEH